MQSLPLCTFSYHIRLVFHIPQNYVLSKQDMKLFSFRIFKQTEKLENWKKKDVLFLSPPSANPNGNEISTRSLTITLAASLTEHPNLCNNNKFYKEMEKLRLRKSSRRNLPIGRVLDDFQKTEYHLSVKWSKIYNYVQQTKTTKIEIMKNICLQWALDLTHTPNFKIHNHGRS